MQIAQNSRPEEVRRGAAYELFVEGGPDSLDPTIFRELISGPILIKPIDGCPGVRAAAAALAAHHPEFFFVTDRDYLPRALVEETWTRFPDPNRSNLIIWRRHELENYFLDPAYLGHSQFRKRSADEIADVITRAAQRRLYFDATNAVVAAVGEELIARVALTQNVNQIKNLAEARAALLGNDALSARPEGTKQTCAPERLHSRLDEVLSDWTGASPETPLSWDQGLWRDEMSGKQILAEVVERCFEVHANDRRLRGQPAVNLIGRELAKIELFHQPDDFKELRRLIQAQLDRSKR